jgi:folate-binding protein YgfZ
MTATTAMTEKTSFAHVPLPGRGLLRLSGPDRIAFLQGLVTNDVAAVASDRAVYGFLLTPQGKFLHDFFMIADGESLLLDCEADRRDDLLRRLILYRLRAKVVIADASAEFTVWATPDRAGFPAGAIVFDDPRAAGLGLRALAPAGAAPEATPGAFDAYERLRISLAAPDGSRDMEVGKSILLENNIDFLNGVAWDKGCYIGQELTARTHYRGLVKRRLVPVHIDGITPPVGTPLIEAGVEIGEMRGSRGNIGLALVRLERLRSGGAIATETAMLTPDPPPALAGVIAGSSDDIA